MLLVDFFQLPTLLDRCAGEGRREHPAEQVGNNYAPKPELNDPMWHGDRN